MKFSFIDRIKSFRHAFAGLQILLQEEHNFRIHLLAALLAVSAGFVFHISSGEWTAILLSIGFVLVSEILNTSIENLADFVSPGKNEQIKKVKDIAAAGVLIAAVTSLVIGIIIFLPKIYVLI